MVHTLFLTNSRNFNPSKFSTYYGTILMITFTAYARGSKDLTSSSVKP